MLENEVVRKILESKEDKIIGKFRIFHKKFCASDRSHFTVKTVTSRTQQACMEDGDKECIRNPAIWKTATW